MTIKTLQVLETIKKEASKNKERSESNNRTRVVSNIEIGKVIRQGDIYIFRVPEDHQVGRALDRRQLVNGASLGARHILVGDDVDVYEGVSHPSQIDETYPLSYAFTLRKGECTITHPEHDNIRLCQVGTYQVTQQMDTRTRRRVAD